ncbi:MAG: cupredoxin domain-containing protein [Burkholderiales bacterium]|nr:cupredoxin domain-containing protein [Burkholderiales bacterium]
MKRRGWLVWAGSLGCGAGLGAAVAQPAPREIELTARRFQYEPSEIALVAGEKVVVRIHSIDFVHGMNLPDLGRRLDLIPGRVTTLELQPMTPGVIDFVCDNFCGEGHERMHGRFVVTERAGAHP